MNLIAIRLPRKSFTFVPMLLFSHDSLREEYELGALCEVFGMILSLGLGTRNPVVCGKVFLTLTHGRLAR